MIEELTQPRVEICLTWPDLEKPRSDVSLVKLRMKRHGTPNFQMCIYDRPSVSVSLPPAQSRDLETFLKRTLSSPIFHDF